jgi:TonB-linked SusC/RagA family outer membrane protein
MKKLYNNWLTFAVMAALVMLATVAQAQTRAVSGTVKDDGGNGMPGVNIIVKGTSTGTVTDVDGNFTIEASEGSVLLFTFIGFRSAEVPVGNQTSVDVVLESDLTSLDEVVITGYSIDKRRELTGSVSTVKTKDLTYAPSGNVEQMLQGRVAGVTVITNGQPGTTSQIRVRGFGAFGGNNPLYVVDGVPTADVSFLNPDDIETTTVLKDASSASIYGARAASGVVVYTTKKGKRNQKLTVTYDNLFGVTTPGKGQDMMNPTDFADWTWRAIRNTAVQNGTDPQKAIEDFNHPQFGKGTTPVLPDYISVGGKAGVSGPIDLEAERAKYNVDPRKGSIYQVMEANKGGTDWYKEITQNAPIFRQTLGFTGAGEAHRFYIGLSTQNQDGILLNNSFKRYVLRANTEFDVLKNLRIGENIQVTYRQVLGQGGEEGGQGIADDENDILQAFRMPTIIPVYDVFGGYAGTAAKGFNNPRNPVANRAGQANNKGFAAGGFGNVYLEYDIIPELTFRTSFGGNYQSYSARNFTRWQYENSENNSAFGYNENQGYNYAWVLTNTATYRKSFGQHSVELLLGQEALNTGAGWDSGSSGLNPFSWSPDYVNMSNVISKQVNSGQYKGSNFSSVFGNIKYAFKEKYILGAVIRRDGSSRFGENERYGVFPAVSAAWRISAENFMQGIDVISDLKIRGGFGTMGNSNGVNPNNQFTLYGGDVASSSYDINGSNSSAVTGFYRTRIGNPDAKWETSVTKNVGIDGQFLGGKIDLIVDFWQKDTKDLLLQVPITATAGPNAAPPSVNVGEMRNRGIDIFIGTKGNLTNDITFEANFNGSFLKNEITALAPGLTYLTTVNPGYRGINPIRNQLGYSISAFYGYQVVGLFRDADEVSNSAKQDGAGPGRFRYKDINGDNVINDKDRTYLGSPVPKFTGGFNFILRSKGFDLEGYIYGSFGNKIFNVSKWFTDFYPSFQGAAISERVKDSWTFENPNSSIPIFESASNFSTNTQSNSFYVESGNYVRFQNITLGYTLPTALLSRIKMTKLRVFISTNNLFTITKYDGLDPAVGGAADTNFGIDLGNYPVTRSYSAGLNLAF